MKKNAKKALAVLFSVLGTVLGLYIGGYWLFARPVYWLVTGFEIGLCSCYGYAEGLRGSALNDGSYYRSAR